MAWPRKNRPKASKASTLYALERMSAKCGTAPCRTRTYNPLIKSLSECGSNPLHANTSSDTLPRRDRACPKPPAADPGLAKIIDAWPALPDPIRRAVLALADSAAADSGTASTRSDVPKRSRASRRASADEDHGCPVPGLASPRRFPGRDGRALAADPRQEHPPRLVPRRRRARRSSRAADVPACADDHVANRLAKAKARPELRSWLAAGAIEVHGWTKRGGKWRVKRVAVEGNPC
jgi:hypothetical protein